MTTKAELTEALKDAMRAKDETRKRVIRLALAAIKNAEIDRNVELDEASILAIIQKEVKSRNETIEGATQAGREDLIAEAEEEKSILEAYLPQPLTTEEIETMVKNAIAETGADTPKQMGLVMKAVLPKVQGRADGKQVSDIVRRQLIGG